MLVRSIFLFYLCSKLSHGELYEYHSGEKLKDEKYQFYKKNNALKDCILEVKPCDENERRRIDGTCNSLKYPARGTFFAPQVRLLPPRFYNGTYSRKAVSGKELPLPRHVRLNLLKAGKSSHPHWNHNIPGYIALMFSDVASVHDAQNMLLKKTDCCDAEHMNDYECTPNIIAEDDPTHRYSGIRCMNSTRPLTHQDFKCTTDPVPSPINQATQAWDLSNVYNTFNKGDKAVRSFSGGKLILEEENGRLFPPNGPNAFCPNNVGDETRCFENHFNALLPVSLFTVWLDRHHNFLADELAKVNPCWDDDTLFEVARDINIAYSQQMYLYEWIVTVQGYENAVKSGIIVKDGGFRDIYDKERHPEVAFEFTYALRWFHLVQPTTAKFFDPKGHFVKDIPLFNITFRMGFLPKENNFPYLTQSTFRAPCRNYDHSVGYDMADNGFPGVQLSIDGPAGDLNKGRNFGMPPYIEYVYHFTGRNITSFDDLAGILPEDKIYLMKQIYEDVADIDMLAGLWSENVMEGGFIPHTLASILNDNALRGIIGDRHWYERPNRPYAFTAEQLKEIRKGTLALFLCNVGDDVIEVPKNAFLISSPENPLVQCSDVPKMDFTAWADEKCANQID